MKRTTVWASVVSTLLFAHFHVFAGDTGGKVIRVTTGDTIEISGDIPGDIRKVHIDGVDAPEVGQPFAEESRKYLEQLLLGRFVTVTVSDGRKGHGEVSTEGARINEILIETGNAWYYDKTLKKDALAEAEKKARLSKHGLWATKAPVAPWEYRAQEERIAQAKQAKMAAEKQQALREYIDAVVREGAARRVKEQAQQAEAEARRREWEQQHPEEAREQARIAAHNQQLQAQADAQRQAQIAAYNRQVQEAENARIAAYNQEIQAQAKVQAAAERQAQVVANAIDRQTRAAALLEFMKLELKARQDAINAQGDIDQTIIDQQKQLLKDLNDHHRRAYEDLSQRSRQRLTSRLDIPDTSTKLLPAQPMSLLDTPTAPTLPPPAQTTSQRVGDHVCPLCNGHMTWTGKTNLDFGKMLKSYKCLLGHEFYFTDKPSPAQSQSDSSSVHCPICDGNMSWTGDTDNSTGKMVKIYKCLMGHQALVK